jgi:hypothetical protein
MKLLIMQFSPPSCHFIPLWSEYSTKHPVLKHPQSLFLPCRHRSSFTPYKTRGKIIVLYVLIILGEEYKLRSSSLCSFLHPPVTSFLLGPNIILNILFSNALSLCSSLVVTDQVSHPYKTRGKIIVLYILTFTFVDSRQETRKSPGLNGSKHYQNSASS